MPNLSLEERVANLEAQVSALAQQGNHPQPTTQPWWEAIWGDFKDDPIYAEAMRLGREYRQSLPSEEDEEVADECT